MSNWAAFCIGQFAGMATVYVSLWFFFRWKPGAAPHTTPAVLRKEKEPETDVTELRSVLDAYVQLGGAPFGADDEIQRRAKSALWASTKGLRASKEGKS